MQPPISKKNYGAITLFRIVISLFCPEVGSSGYELQPLDPHAGHLSDNPRRWGLLVYRGIGTHKTVRARFWPRRSTESL